MKEISTTCHYTVHRWFIMTYKCLFICTPFFFSSFVLKASMQINFNTLPIDTPETVSGLKLVQRSEQPYVALSRGRLLFEAPLPTPITHSLIFTQVDILNDNVLDARPAEKPGSYVTLHTESGSAVVWAMIKIPEFGSHRLHPETFAVYGGSHFAKGQGKGEWSVTSILFKSGKCTPIIFPRLETFNRPYVALQEYSDSIEEIRLLKAAHDYWLFILRHDSASRKFDAPARGVASDVKRPAILKVIHLNEEFQPTTAEIDIFGPTPIYEFDVDAAPDGSAVVFATTPEGVLFARGKLNPGKAFESDRWQITKVDAPLTSPSVLVFGASAHVAAIANVDLPHAAVIYSVVPEIQK